MRVQFFLIAIRVAHFLLTIDIGLIVGEQHVVIAIEQRFHQWAKQLAVAVGEESPQSIRSIASRKAGLDS